MKTLLLMLCAILLVLFSDQAPHATITGAGMEETSNAGASPVKQTLRDSKMRFANSSAGTVTPAGMQPAGRFVDGHPVFDPVAGSGQGASFYVDDQGRRITPTAPETWVIVESRAK